MKVYVEEKDVDVIEGLFDATHCYECWECNRDDNLEIVSLADYTKQVRKEVLKEIDYGAIRKMAERPDDLCYKDALCEYFLDQIQGETNG